MVHHYQRAAQQHQHQHKLVEHHPSTTCSDCLGIASAKRSISKHTLLLRFIGIFSIISAALVFAPRFLSPDSFEEISQTPSVHPPCSSISKHSLCCDRTAIRTDVCFMRGDIRTHSPSNSLLLHLPRNSTTEEQLIRPYTRKWEANTMATIDELHLKTINGSIQACDVVHDVPAVVFSTGGYTGNVYHEFNDGILPLYITAGHFNKQVVFVLLEYHDWWITKYGDILSQLSDHPPIDFTNDRRTHCFPEAIVGLKIHDELTIDPAKMANNHTIRDFRNLLDDSYKPRIRYIEQEEAQSRSNLAPAKRDPRPKMVIVARNGSRMIENDRKRGGSSEDCGGGGVRRPSAETGEDDGVGEHLQGVELERRYDRSPRGGDDALFVHEAGEGVHPGGATGDGLGGGELLRVAGGEDGVEVHGVQDRGEGELAVEGVRGGGRGAERSGERECAWMGSDEEGVS